MKAFSCTFLWVIFNGTHLIAQDTIDTSEPLIVYADKLNPDWLDLDGSAAFLSGDYLKKQRFHTEHDFLASAGLYLGTPAAGQLSIRGLNNDNVLGYFGTRSNSIVTNLVNGVPLSTTSSRYFPRILWNTEEVTVLKGGQSTTHGPNALGGIIYYRDIAPTFDHSGSLRTEFGNFNTFRFSLGQNWTASEHVAMRFDYHRHSTDGSVENVTLNTHEWAKINRHHYKFQTLWEKDESSLHFSLEHDISNSNPFGLSRSFNGFSDSDRRTDENTRTFYPSTLWLGTLSFNTQLDNGISLTNHFGVSLLNVDLLLDFDGSAALPWFADVYFDEHHFSNDFYLTGQHAQHKWSLGSYVQHSSYDVGYEGSGLVGAGIPFESFAEEKVQIAAIYGKYNYTINEKLNLIAGLRINHEEREVKARGNTAFTPPASTSEEHSYTDVLPSLTLAWSPSDTTTTGLKLSRNYRGGGVSYAPSNGINRIYEPEYSNDIELYTRSDLSEKLRLNGAIYYSRLKNMQVPLQVPGGVPTIDTLIQNIGEGRKYGAEIQIRWEPISDVALDWVASYTHTEFLELTLNGIDRKGQAFPNAPEFQTSLGISYLPEHGLFGSIRVSWADSSYSQPQSPTLTALEERTNVSAKIGYKRDQWQIYAYADNLLNDNYALGRTDFTALGLSTVTKMNEPRTYGIGFSTEW